MQRLAHLPDHIVGAINHVVDRADAGGLHPVAQPVRRGADIYPLNEQRRVARAANRVSNFDGDWADARLFRVGHRLVGLGTNGHRIHEICRRQGSGMPRDTHHRKQIATIRRNRCYENLIAAALVRRRPVADLFYLQATHRQQMT